MADLNKRVIDMTAGELQGLMDAKLDEIVKIVEALAPKSFAYGAQGDDRRNACGKGE